MINTMPRPRPATRHSLTWIGHSIPFICGAAIIVLLALFARSKGTGDGFQLPGLGNSVLEFDSNDGTIMIGVFEERPRLWWRPARASLSSLRLTGGFQIGVIADFWGWGIAVPHLFIIALLVIPILWWGFVFRHRIEESQRIELGLCHNCGYDITYSEHRCPECGEVHGNVKWNDDPLPPPPLAS